MPPCCSCRCRAGRSLPSSARGCSAPCGGARCWSTSRRHPSISPASSQRSSRRGASLMPMRRWRAPAFAAERGELCVMVGADAATFARIEPYLRCFASDVLHCGGIGCGQVAKLMNNMVLFEIGGAIAEALAIGRAERRRAGGAARGAEQRLGRQFCAAQPRPKGHVAEKLSGAGVLDPLCAEGPGIRARARRPGRHRRPRRPPRPRAFSREPSPRATATATGP